MKVLLTAAAIIAGLYFLGNMEPAQGSLIAPITGGAHLVTKQLDILVEKAADKAVDAAGNAIRNKCTETISQISYGSDETGLRNKTREEMESEGIPEKQIDEARYKSLQWLYTPKAELIDPKDLLYRNGWEDAVAAFHGSSTGRRRSEIAKEMIASGAPEWYWGQYLDSSPTPPLSAEPTSPTLIADTVKVNIEKNDGSIIWPWDQEEHYEKAKEWMANTPVLPEYAPYYEPLK